MAKQGSGLHAPFHASPRPRGQVAKQLPPDWQRPLIIVKRGNITCIQFCCFLAETLLLYSPRSNLNNFVLALNAASSFVVYCFVGTFGQMFMEVLRRDCAAAGICLAAGRCRAAARRPAAAAAAAIVGRLRGRPAATGEASNDDGAYLLQYTTRILQIRDKFQ